MPNDLQDVDLSHHSRNVCLVFDFIFLKNLDRHLFLCQLVYAFSDFAKSARAKCLTDHVVAYKTIVCSFLTTLGRLPIALLRVCFLFFELSECLPKTSL